MPGTAAAMIQSLLVHGVAAVALAVVVLALGQAAAVAVPSRSPGPWWWRVSVRPWCRCSSAPPGGGRRLGGPSR